MQRWFYLFLGAITALLTACKSNPEPEPHTEAFSVLVYNHLAAVETQCAAFLTDEEGLVRAFQWLPAGDTARLRILKVRKGERFDCTLFQMTALLAPGSGVRDTAVHLITYTDIENKSTVHVRDLRLPAAQYTDLTFSLRDVQTVDSVVVPDGVPFEVPQPENHFRGKYRVFHTGACWLRLKVNGENQWRYWLFPQVQASTLEVECSVSDLPVLPGVAAQLSLPFFGPWTYRLERSLDLSTGRFLSLSPTVPVPGGAIPLFEAISVYEPPALPGQGYRLQLLGSDPRPDGYGYRCDRFFASLPTVVPAPPVDVAPTILANDRLVAAIPSVGTVLLRFIRRGAPNLTWEVLIAPLPGRPVVYRLPDVPAALSSLFSALSKYHFGGRVEVQAEHYEGLSTYREVLGRYLQSDDPLWQMKAGFTARSRIF